jgi:hypothetical protein
MQGAAYRTLVGTQANCCDAGINSNGVARAMPSRSHGERDGNPCRRRRLRERSPHSQVGRQGRPWTATSQHSRARMLGKRYRAIAARSAAVQAATADVHRRLSAAATQGTRCPVGRFNADRRVPPFCFPRASRSRPAVPPNRGFFRIYRAFASTGQKSRARGSLAWTCARRR